MPVVADRFVVYFFVQCKSKIRILFPAIEGFVIFFKQLKIIRENNILNLKEIGSDYRCSAVSEEISSGTALFGVDFIALKNLSFIGESVLFRVFQALYNAESKLKQHWLALNSADFFYTELFFLN